MCDKLRALTTSYKEKKLAADRLNNTGLDKMCKRLRSQPSGDSRLVQAAAFFCYFASFLTISRRVLLSFGTSKAEESETTQVLRKFALWFFKTIAQTLDKFQIEFNSAYFQSIFQVEFMQISPIHCVIFL